MAHIDQRRSQNVAGDFYVDSTCIDCDTCRWMAPDIFHRADSQSAVHHQPTSPTQRQEALQALLACPTASIGTVDKPHDIKVAQESFPLPITENVYHCGYHSEKSFGAASYLIARPDGNVMVDSPRFAAPLVKQIEKLGGIRYLYLTHRDDVADHQKFHDHFKCDRILHTDEITSSTRDTVLLYDQRALFTGDHLAWSDSLGQLYAFRRHCWYSWPELVRSMNKLAQYDFEWVLPGHGRRFHADVNTMRQEMQRCLNWMDETASVRA